MKLLITLGLLVSLTSCSLREEPKYICTQSHDELKYEYGPKLKFDGTMGFGFTWVNHEICDKEELNPKYTGE